MEPVVFLWLILTLAGVGIAGILVLKVKPGKEAVNAALLSSLSSFFLVPFVLWVENALSEHLYAPIATLTFYAPRWYAFLQAFAIAALTEEGLKYLVLFGIFWRSPLRNIQEGMFVGGMQGITFAVMENTLYLFLSSALPQPSEIVSSRVIPLFAHTLIGFWMGYLFIQVRSSRWPSEQVAQLLFAFFFPFLLHGGYDYLAFQPAAFSSLSLVVLLVLIFLSILVLGWLKETPEVTSPPIVRLLDAEDPISAILNSPPQLEQRRRLSQQLLLESGISDYVLINLLSQSPEGMVFEALHLPSRSIQTVKLLSNWKIQAEGVKAFEDLVAFLKKYSPRGIIPYSDFCHKASFTLIARPFGEMTLLDYSNIGIPEAEQREILSAIFSIISELWKQGMEHGRLTPDNILLYQGDIHLADVGMKLILPDREKHREFVRRDALYSGIRGDMYSLSRIASWLTGGYVHITTAEAGKPYSPEQVEKEVTALAIPEGERKILSQRILDRATGWSQKGRELLALWMGLRSQNLYPSPESEHLLNSIGESIWHRAREMLAAQDYPNALRLFSRALSVLPHKAELVTAQLEKTVEEFILRGDFAFFSRKDIVSARKFYETALQVGPLSDFARKKMDFLESVTPFSWSALALIAFFAFSLSLGSYLLLHSLKVREKPQIITAVNPQRTGSDLLSLSTPPEFRIEKKITLRQPDITSSFLYGEYLFFPDASGSLSVYHTSGNHLRTVSLVPGSALLPPLTGCRGWIFSALQPPPSQFPDSLIAYSPFQKGNILLRKFTGRVLSSICNDDHLYIVTEKSASSLSYSEKSGEWEERWRLPGMEFFSAEPVFLGNLLLVFTRTSWASSTLFALEPETGKILWNISPLPPPAPFPPIISQNTLFYLSFSPSSFYLNRINLQKKEIDWMVGILPVKYYPVLAKDQIIISDDTRLSVISAQTGGVKWEKEFPRITSPSFLIYPFLFFSQSIPGPTIPTVVQHFFVVYDMERGEEIQRLSIGNVTASGLGVKSIHFHRRQAFVLFQENDNQFDLYILSF